MLAVLPGYGAWSDLSVFMLQQNIQGKMLHVGKINHLLLPLFFQHTPVKVQHQIKQCAHRLPAGLSTVRRQGQRRCKYFFRQILNAVLYVRPKRLGLLPQPGGYTIVLFGGKAAKGRRGKLPLEIRQRTAPCQLFQHFQLLIRHLSIHIRTFRGLAQSLDLLHFFRAPFDHPAQISGKISAVITLTNFLHIPRRIILLSLLQPLGRPGKACRVPGQL